MSNRICAIMQPTYIPWLGYFEMIDSVDTFVFLDNVQLVKRSWQVRNRINTKNGELFLTIPILKDKNTKSTLISNAKINDKEKWRLQHLKSIEHNYRSKNPFFNDGYLLFEKLLSNNVQTLSEFNIQIIQTICNTLGIGAKFVLASDLGTINKTKDELLVEICGKVGCSRYLSPQGSAVYIEKETPGGAFAENDVELYYHNYSHPSYNQQNGKTFLPFMSIVDLLLSSGVQDSNKIILSGREPMINYKKLKLTGNDV